jgi:signal transduction histidine kinase
MEETGNNGIFLLFSSLEEDLTLLPPEGKWEYDLIHQTNIWSDTIFKIFELSIETKPDKSIFFKFFGEPYLAMFKLAFEEASQSGLPWDLELEIMTGNMKTTWVRSRGYAFVQDNNVVKVQGTFKQIDKYRTEKTLHTLLQQRHRQLSGFTYILTHNLRTYAYNIAMLTELMERGQLNASNTELLDKISMISNNLITTIEDISDVLKVNQSVVDSELMDFEDVTRNVCTVMRAELDQHNATIETDFILRSIFFPRLYLESVLMNLISNSIKYKKDDEKPLVLISTYLDDEKNCVVLEYQDNGIGIDLERNGDKIFGLYKTFTQRRGAHGIGLFLVKTQIESQGGYILVESTPDVGTIFRMFFKPNS